MNARPAPDPMMLAGALLALAGYLLPWFRKSDGYMWSFSGWAYASLSSGGGWTLLTFAWLVLALGGALWARSSSAAATTGVVGGVGSLTFTLVVVAASFGEFSDRGSINWIAEMPFGVGLPAAALGFGLLLAGGIRAIIRTTLAETAALGPASATPAISGPAVSGPAVSGPAVSGPGTVRGPGVSETGRNEPGQDQPGQ